MKPRVLVVDDEAELVELTKFNLEQQGFDILTAGSGMEALNVARRELPDVVLMDLMLPDLDGFSVCEILRAQPSTANLPIIVLSALNGNSVHSRALDTGVCCCFTKPVNMKALGDSIRSACAAQPEPENDAFVEKWRYWDK